MSYSPRKALSYILREHVLRRSEAEQLRYLPQSVKLEEAVSPHIIRLTMLLISGAILTFIIWAAFTNIREVTKAQGEVVPEGFVQVVQHMDGGIVTEILTSEGELVQKGQILLHIDDGSTRQDLAEAQARQTTLAMQAERLRAFIDDKTPDFTRLSAGSEKYIEQQRRIFESMVAEKEKQTQVAREQVTQMHDERAVLLSRRNKVSENFKIAEEALGLQAKLRKQGHTSRLTFLRYQKEFNSLKGEVHEIDSQIKKNQTAIKEYEGRLVSLEAQYQNDAYQELDRIESSLAQNEEAVKKLQNRVSRLEVRSPVYGLVQGLNVNTIGGVIAPGKTLMEVVPLDQNLVVEAHISPRDIGHLQVGQTVRVKISSYDFARYGALDGNLAFISATTFPGAQGQPYYRGRISLSQNYVGDDPQKNIVLPGMTAEADIVTGKKTILAYLLKPIHLSLRTALTER